MWSVSKTILTMWEISAKIAGLQVECEAPRYGSATVITTPQSSIKMLRERKVGHMLTVPWRQVTTHSHRRY